MRLVLDLLVGLVTLGVALVASFRIGIAWQERSRTTRWLANGFVLAAGLASCAAGEYFGLSWLWPVGIGVMAGGFSGLKYGFANLFGLAAHLRKEEGQGASEAA